MNPVRMLARRLGLRIARNEDGFSLVELMVALGVVLTAVLSLAYTATIGFSDIALARQRQSANQLANRLIEEVRALPFDTVAHGLANSDLAGDAAIVTSGCPGGAAYCYRATPTAALEEIPRGDNAAVSPLVPHRAQVTVGPTTYTRAVYVTYLENDKSRNAYRVTVEVTWPNPARTGARPRVQAQTIVHSPRGCVSTSTHPFAAPCQPFFYGTAQAAQGRIEVTGPLQSISFSRGALFTSGHMSNVQIEQVAAIQGTAWQSGVTLAAPSEQSLGRASASSYATNDPVQSRPYDSQGVGTQASATLSASGGGNSVSVNSASAVAGQTISAAAASTAQPCGSQLDSQPCGRSTTTQGSVGMTLGLDLGFLNLGLVNVASIGAGPTAGVSFAHRELVTGQDGYVHSQASRSLGTVALAPLPAGLLTSNLPLGWDGSLVSISGFGDEVVAQAGAGTTTGPTVSTAGQIRFWNGLGYTTVPVGSSSDALPIPAVHVEQLGSGGLVTIDITANLRRGGTSVSETPKACSPTPCPSTRLAAEARSNSPVIGTIRYVVRKSGSVVTDLTTNVDLGTVSAKSSYSEGPSGA